MSINRGLLATIIVTLVAEILSVGVSTKSKLREKKDNADDDDEGTVEILEECALKLMACYAPTVRFVDSPTTETIAEIKQNGLSRICTPLTNYWDCWSELSRECELPLSFEEQVAMNRTVAMVDFLCKENFRDLLINYEFSSHDELTTACKEAIDADRECLFGETFLQAVTSQCGEPFDEIGSCQIISSTQATCSANVYESVCGNPTLAAKFRHLMADLDENAACNSAEI